MKLHKHLLTAAMIMALGVCGGAYAAEAPEQNPWGLIYRGAITHNVKGHVNIRPVSYKLNGLKIAANVYTPADYNPALKYPAVVVAHPNGGVKEQVAGLYAQRLAELGYITITADAAYQGASEGEPPRLIRVQAKANRAIRTYLITVRKISTAWPITLCSTPALTLTV